MIEIEKVEKAVQALLYKNFIVTAEKDVFFTFRFKIYNFYHLFGFQYLTDLPDIANEARMDETVKRFLRGDIPVKYLQKSLYFDKIESRIEHFPVVEDMLINDRCKIIIDFDPAKVESTKVKSRYFLYKTEDYNTYRLLGIACSPVGEYYPETFFVEPSKYYITEQNLLDCTIECIEKSPKKKKS